MKTEPTNKAVLSRRDALKLLGAAAGATVLANLPSKWSTPALTAGVLPAHAQTSCTMVTLTVMVISLYQPELGKVIVEPPSSICGPGPGPCPYEYCAGTEVTLTAVPNQGRRFVDWSGHVSPAPPWTNPLVITMNTDMLVWATFNID